MLLANYKDLNPEEFKIKLVVIAGVDCVLIIPEIDAHWNMESLIYRSSVWTAEGYPVSLSFKKFFNWEEQIQLVPIPTNLADCDFPEKIDGSCLIVSKFNGQLIIRTRGTVDARQLDNGYEIDYLIEKYPSAFDNEMLDEEKYSIIYEWTTPNNRIILDYGEDPSVYLTGIVRHEDYSYLSQDSLNDLAQKWRVKRPKIYHFDSIDDMVKSVEAFDGVEGVCAYFNRGQEIKKVKGLKYLALHRFKSQCTIKNLVDLFFQNKFSNKNEFFSYIESNFDFECAKMSFDSIDQIIDAWDKVEIKIQTIRDWLPYVQGMDRKEAAQKIIERFGPDKVQDIAFSLLDGKNDMEKKYRRLMGNELGIDL